MAHADNIRLAKALTALGMHVFPAYVKDTENPYKKAKTPGTPNGFLDATPDPFYVEDLFERHPKAEVAVFMGASGLLAVDIDVKRGPDGKILVDGFDNFDSAFLDLPETFAFDSVSRAGGRQYIYLAPEGKNLGPSSDYRGIEGLDIRAGGSWSVWPSDVAPPTSRAAFASAPEWALDEKSARTGDRFTGTVQQWYETLEAGDPTGPVLKAMSKTRGMFENHGNDFSHGDLVELQYEAVRLGAEGHSGVPQLLDLIEELTLSREGEHSRNPDEWEHEFQEALASGIRKAGDAIELRKNLPEYSIRLLPESISDSLVTGPSADKSGLFRVLRALVDAGSDEMDTLSILWNAQTTKDLAREWGLEFCLKIIRDEYGRRDQSSAPVALRDEPETEKTAVSKTELLTKEQRQRANKQDTFIDKYLRAAEEASGFVQPAFAEPLAWMTLSMAMGTRGVIKRNNGLPTNLWFVVLGYSGSGKSISVQFASNILDKVLGGHEIYWNTGVGSPEGMSEALVQRDNLPTALLEDEAAGFYRDLVAKDWMQTLPNNMANWYMGQARAPQKVRLKDLKGKTAEVSFCFFTISTPEETLRVIDESFFGTGFMARPAWIFGPPPSDSDERYVVNEADLTVSGVSRQVIETAVDLILLESAFPAESRTPLWGEEDARKLLERAHMKMARSAKRDSKYTSIIEPSVKRLDETMWKCASLLAMYRGSSTFDMDDALVALKYGEVWYANLLKVSREIAGAYLRDAKLMVDYVREQGGRVTRPELIRAFGHVIKRSRTELTDRIDYLVDSGLLVRTSEDRKVYYEIGE